MLGAIQLLIARHPDLLAAPEEMDLLDAEPPLPELLTVSSTPSASCTDALAGYRDALHQAREPGPATTTTSARRVHLHRHVGRVRRVHGAVPDRSGACRTYTSKRASR